MNEPSGYYESNTTLAQYLDDGVENDALTISELIACLQEQASTDLLAGRLRKQMH